MNTTHDWLPKNHEALYDKGQQTWEYLTLSPNRERMGFDTTSPQGVWLDSDYVPKFQAFVSAFDAWKNPADRTPAMTRLLEMVEKVYRVSYRQLYTGFLKNSPLVTDKDLFEMGLPERHTGGGTPAPVAKTYPEFHIDSGTICRLIIHFYDLGKKKSKAKPPGQHGAEIRWMISETPMVDANELVNSSFDTRTPFTLEFGGHERGKLVYFALRWENTRGEKGPWSKIMSAIIP
jgi:hypothetical protein